MHKVLMLSFIDNLCFAAGSFTNHTYSNKNYFTGTLDYIFVSNHFSVTEVVETPEDANSTVRLR